MTADAAGTRYVLGGPGATAEQPGPKAVDVTEQAEVRSTGPGEPGDAATGGEPVLGRRTYVLSDGVLWIDGIRPGRSIALTPTGPGSTLADLYRVARGIRWTG